MPLDHQTDCPICVTNFYEEFSQHGEALNGQTIAEVQPCGHYFHSACINQWYHAPGSNQLCPVCNAHLGATHDVTREAYEAYYSEATGYFMDK